MRELGGCVDRRYRLRSWLLSISALANDLASRPKPSCLTPPASQSAFILGHWRSGTTLLHEVLAMDPRFAAPTLVDCLTPTSGAIQRWIIQLGLRVFLPQRRPIDEAPWGPNRPAEDDLALSALGLSPYLAWSFPRNAAAFERYLDLQGLNEDELEEWRIAMTDFLNRIANRHGLPPVFKSPPHTARLQTLSGIFPDAKFVFVHRHPFATFASTMRLTLDGTRPLRLQELSTEDARAGVLRRAKRMFDAYSNARKELPPERLVEVAYDDLVKDPVAAAESILRAWGMAPDPTMGGRWRVFQRDSSPTRPTPRVELSDADRKDVRLAFGFLFDEFGYE